MLSLMLARVFHCRLELISLALSRCARVKIWLSETQNFMSGWNGAGHGEPRAYFVECLRNGHGGASTFFRDLKAMLTLPF